MRTSASATSGIRYGGGVGRGFSYRGTYREAVRLASGRYALVKNAQEFTLAPLAARDQMQPWAGGRRTRHQRGNFWRVGRDRGVSR